VQRNRATNALEVIKRFPVQGLTPEIIRGVDQRSFVLAALETALGTPEGRLPVTSAQTGAAAGMAAALAGTTLEELGHYAEARLLLMQSKPEAEKKALELTAADLQVRFKRFAAWSKNDPAARIAGLAAIEQTTDTRAALITLGRPDEGPPVTTEGGADPLAWLFVDPAEWSRLAPDDRAMTAARVDKRLEQFRSSALFRLAENTAQKTGLTQMSLYWRERALSTARREARQSLGQAYESGSKGDYSAALLHFKAASEAQPIDLQAARLYLRTAVQQNDKDAIAVARALLLSKNQHPETVDGLVQKYLREAAQEQNKAPAPTP
jgi:hypothetical protein